MTREQLIDLLKAEVGKQVGERVEAALAKADENRTKWMEQIVHGLQQKATPAAPGEKGIVVGRIARAVAAGRMDLDKSIAFAKKAWKGDESEEVVKALSAGTGSEGGFLVPTVRSTDFIELLRPRVIVRRLGAVEYPLTNGNAEIPKQTAGTTAGYIGENQDIGAQKPAFGMIKLTAKKLAALVPISNDLLRYNNPAADTIVRDDLLNGVRVREDLAFIRDNGTQYTPKGMRYWVAAANILVMTATPDLAKITTDLGRMILALEEANVAFTRPGWMMAPRTRHGLMTIRDANGNLAYAAEMARGTLMGYPFGVTTQIPRNLGGGTESELYLADFADVVIGQADSVEVATSSEASYKNESAVLVSAFSQDQTVIRVIEEHDLCVRHAESVAVMTGLTWGV